MWGDVIFKQLQVGINICFIFINNYIVVKVFNYLNYGINWCKCNVVVVGKVRCMSKWNISVQISGINNFFVNCNVIVFVIYYRNKLVIVFVFVKWVILYLV